jgi:hypothetical protein
MKPKGMLGRKYKKLSFRFHSRIRKWEDVTADELYVVLALFMLMGTVQEPTLRSHHSKNWLLFTLFFGSAHRAPTTTTTTTKKGRQTVLELYILTGKMFLLQQIIIN